MHLNFKMNLRSNRRSKIEIATRQLHIFMQLPVSFWLIQYMFSGEEPVAAKKKATKIVKKLNANNKSHSRHFTVDFCKELGLNITELESDQTLQELVLSVHHAFIITIDATAATKLIENQNGARYITSQKK